MPRLIDPLRVGSLVLRNRIVMPPMATHYASLSGHVSDALLEHYVERAGDLGLLIVEHAYVSRGGRLRIGQPGVYSDDLMHGWEKLVEAIKKFGTPIALQINHAGGATVREVCGRQPVAPSPIIHPTRGKELPRELSIDEIGIIVEDFREAARRAAEAGFDGVEIHGAHGFLLGQFLSPLTNRRTDEFGGSLENRSRLHLMILEKVKQELGGDVLLLYRLGVEDMMPGGLTLDDGVKAARIIAGKSVDILDVSGGLVGIEPPSSVGPGFFVPQAAAVREATGKPVIGVGGIKTAEEADAIIRSGRVDLVAIGRAMLKEPKWASKALKQCKKR